MRRVGRTGDGYGYGDYEGREEERRGEEWNKERGGLSQCRPASTV
jgi:hypothetical protein